MKKMRTMLNELKLRCPWNIELNLSNRHLGTPVWNLGSVFGLEAEYFWGASWSCESKWIIKRIEAGGSRLTMPGAGAASSQQLGSPLSPWVTVSNPSAPHPMRTATPCTLASTQGGLRAAVCPAGRFPCLSCLPTARLWSPWWLASTYDPHPPNADELQPRLWHEGESGEWQHQAWRLGWRRSPTHLHLKELHHQVHPAAHHSGIRRFLHFRDSSQGVREE